MTNKTDMQLDPPYLDDEERQMMESLDAAMDRGEIQPKTAEEVAKINTHWNEILEASTQRRAITLRLQNRDLSMLKSIAKRRGIPYQTLVTSVLHQFANGDIVERT